MTTPLRPVHMYEPTTIHFTNPFGSKDIPTARPARSGDGSFFPANDFRALTPPPEMSEAGATHSWKPGYQLPQEHVHHYGDYVPSRQVTRAPVGPYLPDVTNVDFGRNGITTQPSSRAISPVFTSRQTTMDDSQIASHQRQSSRTSSIAPSFQIPKSVNDSGGSLAELAAEVSLLDVKAVTSWD
jgi:hypothetical protein